MWLDRKNTAMKDLTEKVLYMAQQIKHHRVTDSYGLTENKFCKDW